MALISVLLIGNLLSLIVGGYCELTWSEEVSMLNYYNAIGCTKINDCDCPMRFECPEFGYDGKCHALGVTYDVGENVDIGPISNACSPMNDCTCDQKESNETTISCRKLAFKCVVQKPQKGCWIGENFKDCCKKPEYCQPKNVTCYANGNSFKYRQAFTPESVLDYICLCTADFQDTPSAISSNPDCRPINCYYPGDNESQAKRKEGCVPVFTPGDLCASEYKCVSAGDITSESQAHALKASSCNATCSFGGRDLNVGDQLFSEDGVTCICAIPPMLTCTRQ